MQELLFGPSSVPSSSTLPSSSSVYTPSTGSRGVQKPQPVRPSSTSAFSAYVPGRGLGASSPDSPPSYSYTRPSFSSYSTAPSKTSRDFHSSNSQSPNPQSPIRQSPPKLSSSLFTRPTALSLTSSYSQPKPTDSGSLARSGSLRASTTRGNWKDMFPSLSRQPSSVQASAASGSSGPPASSQTALARFCHECGNPFPMPHVRFCCECGVKRMYC